MTITTTYGIGDKVWIIEARCTPVEPCGECGGQLPGAVWRNEVAGPHTIESINISVGEGGTEINYVLVNSRWGPGEDGIYPTRQIALVALEELT